MTIRSARRKATTVKSGGVGHSAAMVRRVNKFKDPGNVTANRITALENDRARGLREHTILRKQVLKLKAAKAQLHQDLNYTLAALHAIGEVLSKAERNRFGKLEFWADARQECEQLRLLAVAWKVDGSLDTADQCGKVALKVFDAVKANEDNS